MYRDSLNGIYCFYCLDPPALLFHSHRRPLWFWRHFPNKHIRYACYRHMVRALEDLR